MRVIVVVMRNASPTSILGGSRIGQARELQTQEMPRLDIIIFPKNSHSNQRRTTVKPRFKGHLFIGFPLFKGQISADRFSLKYINYPHLRDYPDLRNHLLLIS